MTDVPSEAAMHLAKQITSHCLFMAFLDRQGMLTDERREHCTELLATQIDLTFMAKELTNRMAQR